MNTSRNRFEGKGVVVTGAEQVIGRAVAKAFAAEGAGLILLDNEGDVLASTVDAIRGTGVDVEAVVGDVSRREDVRGAIVVTASTNAFQPEAGGLAYNTSKSGQVAVMHTAALELSRHGIRVNALAPGIINTRLSAFVINHPVQSKVFLDRIPIGRFAEPEEMARPILWMCSEDASYLSGHLMVVDGAMTVGLP